MTIKRIGVFLIALAAWFVFAWSAAKFLIVEKPLSKADAILILSGSSAYRERCFEAAELFSAGKTAKIFLTNDGQQGGWSRAEARNLYPWEMSHRELTRRGVPAEAVELLPGTVASTRDEAATLVRAAKERGLRSILLVTSGYHSRRTLWLFERAASENNLSIEFGVESPPVGWQTPAPRFWWLQPKGWRDVAGEYLKFAYYWLFY